MRTTLFSIVMAAALGVWAFDAPEASAQKGKGWRGGYGGNYYNPGWGGYGGYYPGYYGGGYGYGSGISFGGRNWGVTIGGSPSYYGGGYYGSGYYPYSSYYGSSYYPYSSYAYSQPYYSYSPSYGYYSTPSYSYGSPTYQSGYYTPAQPQQPTGPVENVAMQGNQFKPNKLNIAVGTTVRWTNKDQNLHNVAQPSQNWKSQDLSNGDNYTWTFTEPGTYNLQCGHHPNMRMTITVGQNQPQNPDPNPVPDVQPGVPPIRD